MADVTESNRRTIRAAFEAWQAGTGAIADVFADGLVWRIEGHSLASREYGSRQAFVDGVLAPFAARFAAGEPFRPVRIRSVHADGDAWSSSGTGAASPMTASPTPTATPGSWRCATARSSTARRSTTALS